MASKHMNLKRVTKRVKEEFGSTIEIARVLNVRDAVSTFRGKVDIQLMVHNGHKEWGWIRKHLLKKHEVMNLYLDKTCPKLSDERIRQLEKIELNEEYKDCIWICWWQGIDQAPSIVKKCVDSIRKHAGNHKVIIITDKNYKDYVDFPEWLLEKKDKGIITKTHMSDLLRLKLLGQYGGIWLDSTFYCTDSLEAYFERPVWSIKRPDYRHTSVACGYFANYSFGCQKEYRVVFNIIAEYLLMYWKTNDYMIDYLFLDYLIVQAQRKHRMVKEAFDLIEPNNPECDELLKILGNKYEEKVWNRMKKETALFKLTWKANFPKEISGDETFYGKLIARELI